MNARVIPRCTVDAIDLDFGTLRIMTAVRLFNNMLSVVCTPVRPMRSASMVVCRGRRPDPAAGDSGAGTILYGLYRDSTRLIPWGNDPGINMIGTTGMPGAAPRIQASNTDTVVVTVIYCPSGPGTEKKPPPEKSGHAPISSCRGNRDQCVGGIDIRQRRGIGGRELLSLQDRERSFVPARPLPSKPMQVI